MSYVQNESAYNAAIRINILRNARKTWMATYGQDAETIMHDANNRRHFDGPLEDEVVQKLPLLDKLAYSLAIYGKLTEKQTALYIKVLADHKVRQAQWDSEREARKATKQWIGEVGQKKVSFDVTVLYYSCEWVAMGHCGNVRRQFIIMQDSEGNGVQYSGGSLPEVQKGDRLTFTATIKDHIQNDKHGKSTKVGMVKNFINHTAEAEAQQPEAA